MFVQLLVLVDTLWGAKVTVKAPVRNKVNSILYELMTSASRGQAMVQSGRAAQVAPRTGGAAAALPDLSWMDARAGRTAADVQTLVMVTDQMLFRDVLAPRVFNAVGAWLAQPHTRCHLEWSSVSRLVRLANVKGMCFQASTLVDVVDQYAGVVRPC